MAKVSVDANACIGCGACASVCAEVFEMGSDGKSHAKMADSDAACAKQAADVCPVNAIKVE